MGCIFHSDGPSLQAETSAQAKQEVAKREKDRLRQQEKQRKANLEKLRHEQNEQAAIDDVRATLLPGLPMDLQRVFVDSKNKSLLNVCHVPFQHLLLMADPQFQASKGRRRLQFLLKQAEVFQHFAPEAAETEKKR